MPISILSISREEATRIANAIIQKAQEDGGAPVAVAIVDATARLLFFAAMDKVLPASIRLSQSKAYSAVIGQRDTAHWASIKKNGTILDFDMRNWTDGQFSGFTGGVAITFQGSVIGGIGISGRKGEMSESDNIMQDNELANLGKNSFQQNSDLI